MQPASTIGFYSNVYIHGYAAILWTEGDLDEGVRHLLQIKSLAILRKIERISLLTNGTHKVKDVNVSKRSRIAAYCKIV
jgi:hypothetical protein